MNILAQYLYSFTLLFFVQQLACFKCQAQRILTSIQNVCDVVEPSGDHTTSTSINIDDTLTITQSTCVKNFQVTVASSTYVNKYLIFEIFFQDLTADLRLRPLLLERSGSLPELLVNSTSGAVYYDSDTEDLNGFVNRKSYQNIVIAPSDVTLNKVFYFSLYYYTDDTANYFSATNTYEIKVRSTSDYPCPNDCSGSSGTCSQSLKKCICKAGYFDLDCSVTATKISYDNFEEITIDAQESQLFYTTIQGPVQTLKVYFNKTVGNVDLLFRINPKNSFDLPNLDGLLGEDQLSYSLESTYIIFPYEFLKNYFGNSLLINAFNTNSDSVIVKTMAEIYDEGVANRETLMIIMIGVSGFFIIMWAIITITKYKILRDLGALLQPENDRNEERRQVLSTEDMDRYFSKKKFKEHVFSFAQNTCSICLEDFQPDSLCRQLYCEHIYHGKCIEDWLAQHESCPNCKKSMLKTDIEEFLSAPKNEQILLSAEAQEGAQDSSHPFKRSDAGLEVQEEEKQNNENSLQNINIKIKEYRTEKKDQYGLEEGEARRNFRDKRSQSNSKYQSKLNLMEAKKSNSQRDIDGRKLSNQGASQLIDLDVEEHEMAGKLSSSSINLENRIASRKSRSVSEKNPLQKYKNTPDNQSPIKGDNL